MSLGSIQLFSSEYWNSRNMPSDCSVVGWNPPFPTRNFISEKSDFLYVKSNFLG